MDPSLLKTCLRVLSSGGCPPARSIFAGLAFFGFDFFFFLRGGSSGYTSLRSSRSIGLEWQKAIRLRKRPPSGLFLLATWHLVERPNARIKPCRETASA